MRWLGEFLAGVEWSGMASVVIWEAGVMGVGEEGGGGRGVVGADGEGLWEDLVS